MQTETAKGKRVKTPKKAEKKTKETEKQLEKIASKAAQATIKKFRSKPENFVDESITEEVEDDNILSGLFSEAQEDPSLEDEQDQREMVATEPVTLEEVEDQLGDFDIFEFGAAEAVRRGDMPKFRIYRSGEFLCVKLGQYSYERLQKEYKGGHYKIYAYSNITNKYLKAQSKMIADPLITEQDQPQQQGGAQGGNVAEIITALKDVMGLKAHSEAEEIRAKSDGSATQMTMMMSMMQQQFQMQMQMVQAQQKESQRMIELMLTLNANKPKNNDLSPMELITLLEKSKTKGATEFKELFAMAKELAEDMRESEEPTSREGGESVMDSLIKNFAPLIAAGMNQPQQAQPQPQPQPQRPPLPAPNPHLVATRPTTPVATQPQPQQQAQPLIKPQEVMPQTMVGKIEPLPVPAQAKPIAPGPLGIHKPETEDDSSDDSEDELGEGESVFDSLGEGEEYVGSDQDSELINPDFAEPIELKGEETVNEIQTKVMNLLATDLVKAALMGSKADNVAPNSYIKLKKNGILPKMILDNFSQDSILNAAREKGLPPKYEQQLKDFYAIIENLAKRDLNLPQ